LLLSHRADVNASSQPTGFQKWLHMLAIAQVAIFGYANCKKMSRLLASLPGITPLGCAAMVGHEELTKLFLDHGAELFPNSRGEWPEDLA
ncbi:ANK2, partial [Symbiodinium pilosum]